MKTKTPGKQMTGTEAPPIGAAHPIVAAQGGGSGRPPAPIHRPASRGKRRLGNGGGE